MNVGEKIETIIHSRKSGLFGRYLGSTSYTFGACVIDGVQYCVRRCIDGSEPWYWQVKNVSTGKTVDLVDQWDLPSLQVL